MTPAQAAWLRKLRDEGMQPLPKTKTRACRVCWLNGWSMWHEASGHHSITPAGLAALAAYEEKVK
jgi:hypothetical protein